MQYIRKLLSITPDMDLALKQAAEREAEEKGCKVNYSDTVRAILAEGLRSRGLLKGRK